MLIPFSAKCSGNVPQRTRTESSSMETAMTCCPLALTESTYPTVQFSTQLHPRLLKMKDTIDS